MSRRKRDTEWKGKVAVARGRKRVKREQRWTKNRAGRAIRCNEYLINLLAWMYLIPRRRGDTRTLKGPAKSRRNSYHLVNPRRGVATFLTPPSRRRCHRPGVTTWAFLRTSGCCLSFRVKRKAITKAGKEKWWRRELQCAWLICWRSSVVYFVDCFVRYNRMEFISYKISLIILRVSWFSLCLVFKDIYYYKLEIEIFSRKE